MGYFVKDIGNSRMYKTFYVGSLCCLSLMVYKISGVKEYNKKKFYANLKFFMNWLKRKNAKHFYSFKLKFYLLLFI